jgi:hypothetical protein
LCRYYRLPLSADTRLNDDELNTKIRWQRNADIVHP